MPTIKSTRAAANWVQDHILPYDALPYANTVHRNASRCALFLVAVFLLFGAALIGFGLLDNKPTTASTGLATAHRMVTLNLPGWFREGIWWRGQQTPTPLPYTIHGVYFAVFGYSIRAILLLHTLVGALAAWLLFRVTARRFGPWTGVLAMALYFGAPLVLYVTFSGWTFVWATFFLLLSIDFLDRAVLVRRIPLYLLAGVALGCAGMSRPENYAVALLVALFVEIPLRYRVAFVLLTFAYPIAQYVHNNLYLGDATGLRILEDTRKQMSYGDLFHEWFRSVRAQILNRNFTPAIQYFLIPAVLLAGLPRRRFLTSVLLYFCVAFFAAYAMRRISFNHEGYYFAHVILLIPFVAAALAWLARALIAVLRRIHLPDQPAKATGALLVIAVLLVQGVLLREAYATRLFFRVPEPVRELRDFLNAHLGDRDRIVLDYFPEVSWMLAEIECAGGRDAWNYSTNMSSEPRPRVNAVRKDLTDEEFALVNTWVSANFHAWVAQRPPRYLVTLSDDAWMAEWARKGATGHYRLFSLRPALGLISLDRIEVGGSPEITLTGKIVFENDIFSVYELETSDTSGE